MFRPALCLLAVPLVLSARAARAEPPKPVEAALGCNGPCPDLPFDEDEFRMFGVRGTESLIDAPGTDAAAGVLAAFKHRQYTTSQWLTTRAVDFGFIGGGSAGFEGGLGGDVALGFRAPFGRRHGPFARIGLDAFLWGNDLVYSSQIELPKGQLGYQWLDHNALVEIAASAGPLLTGRYRVEGATPRKLGDDFEWGGHLALAVAPVRFSVEASRVRDRDLPPLDRLFGEICGVTFPVAVCLDARFMRGEVDRAGQLVDTRAAYLGGALGVMTASHSGP